VRFLGVAALLCSVLVVRVISSAKDELGKAEALASQGDVEGAIVHFRRAARWYAPASPYHVTALDRLAKIGAKAEAEGQLERALRAYRSVRGSILATRSFYVPERARLHAANERIAALMAEQPPPGMDAGKSKAQIAREHLALLTPIPGPSVLWTVVLLLGFFGWVSAAFAFSVRAIDEHDRWVPAEARKWGAVMALGFGLFVLGMALA
jgi:tetratricopeptide (TPR) repeat protein